MRHDPSSRACPASARSRPAPTLLLLLVLLRAAVRFEPTKRTTRRSSPSSPSSPPWWRKGVPLALQAALVPRPLVRNQRRERVDAPRAVPRIGEARRDEPLHLRGLARKHSASSLWYLSAKRDHNSDGRVGQERAQPRCCHGRRRDCQGRRRRLVVRRPPTWPASWNLSGLHRRFGPLGRGRLLVLFLFHQTTLWLLNPVTASTTAAWLRTMSPSGGTRSPCSTMRCATS